MKSKIFSLTVLAFTSFSVNAVDEEPSNYSFSEALQNGETTINTQTFYFNRSFDKPGEDDAEALTVGGIMKYESANFSDTKVALAYYGSHRLFGITDRDQGGGTSILQSNGDDIAFLGEAYIDFNTGDHQLQIGRQRLSTPLMGDHAIRLLPSSYEAAVYRNKSFKDTTLEAGYVSRYSGFTSKLSGFDEQEGKWGTDGLIYMFADTELAGVAVRAQFIDTQDDSGTFKNYKYVDAKLPIGIGQETYIKGQYGGTGYEEGDSSKMLGVKAGTTFGPLDLAVLYNKIEDNEFKAVESGPMYSDWQQGYGNYEPSDAVGMQLIYHPSENASVKLGFVDVESEDNDAFNNDTFTEANLDVKYQISEVSKLRVRYSIKDQDDESDREDRDDFRIIYYYDF